MIDYSISWGYIVSRMESLYGIGPDSEEKVAYGNIERRMNYIWQEYFEMLYKEEFGAEMEEWRNRNEINRCRCFGKYGL